MGKTYSISARIKGKDDGASSTVRRVGRGISRSLLSPLRAVNRSITGMRRGLQALPGLGMIAGGISRAVTGLADFTTGFSEAADLIAKTSRRAGIATNTLQELAFAGELAGMTTQETSKAMEVFGRVLGQAKSGGGELLSLLKRVDPDLQKMLVSTQTADEALDLYLETMAAVTDPSKRAALAVAAFGEAGVKMGLLVENGTEALRAQRREAHELGRVLAKETLGEAEAFNDELTRLKSSWGGLKSVFGAALIKEGLPHLRKLSTWISENRGQIFQMARGFAEDVVGGIKSVVSALPGLVSALQAVAGVLGDIWGFAEKIAKALSPGSLMDTTRTASRAQERGLQAAGLADASGNVAPALRGILGDRTPAALMREREAPVQSIVQRWRMESLGAAGVGAAGGAMVIRFEGAPAGMRIERTPPGVKTTIATGRRE